MLHIDESTAEAVSAYVAGWAVSRGAPAPTKTALGWHVATAQPQESERAVPIRGSATEVLGLAESLRTRLACLKFAGLYDDWRPHFGPEWADNPIGWFMTASLERRPIGRLATGSLEVSLKGDLVAATVSLGKDVIASGRTGIAGEWCVPDRIRTSEQYRRQGLGSVIMRALLVAAQDAGAERAVLDSSTDGRRLYEAMGWTTCSQQFGLTRRCPGVEG